MTIRLSLPDHVPTCRYCGRKLSWKGEKQGKHPGWWCPVCNILFNVDRGEVIGQKFPGLMKGVTKEGEERRPEATLMKDEQEDFVEYCGETGQSFNSPANLEEMSYGVRKSVIEAFRQWRDARK